MANLQVQKKRSAAHLPQDGPPAKRAKSMARPRPNFPPEFWDNLSKVRLTPRALRELNRRNDKKPQPLALVNAISTDLAHFARHGGPDLCHLRQCPQEMSSRRGSQREPSRSTRKKTGRGTSRSTPYDGNFEGHLNNYNIYIEGRGYDDGPPPEPRNLDDIHRALAAPRRSLSPSRVSRSSFRDFKYTSDLLVSESKVLTDIIPKIRGDSRILSENDLTFTNLSTMTGDKTTNPSPDMYDGAYPGQINRAVRESLNKTIIPTKHSIAPVAPNFFLEAKGPDGSADVAKRQACFDGAYGTRAMHALQNYGQDKPKYDGNAYTYSSTYNAGTAALQLYAHHVRAPETPEGRPEYHMTQVDGYLMTGNIDSFRRGATAYRNARDLAQSHRDRFIREANARASQTRSAAAERQQVGEDRRPYLVTEYDSRNRGSGSPSRNGYGPSASPSSYDDPDRYKRSRESASPPSRGSRESKKGRR